MHLTLSPQQGHPGQPETTLHVSGDVIMVDGTPYDLSTVPEGGEGWPEGPGPFVGPITRKGGVLHATLIARLDSTAALRQGGPWVIEHASGDVTIPAKRKPEPEEGEI